MKLVEEVRTGRQLPPPDVARSIRLAAGVSQSRLARELGVHRLTVARWESGTRRPCGEQRASYVRLLARLHREVTR
ncbi:hypothetical protein GCM10012275_42010 [Longimycelium tulufanense]|uniref:HTH cro/C1-type domain-containing protein n=1 Tax=Longimycelium tulufanense TaxID=907463 RepID=A0A8J3CFB2_9PSEU|nr:helix-turn-helix transcriptional regulator [Longimycelium tulufanense]GGM67082.1 hypothetical protein GCM10012275_42010 [Longimycelium tulufanense]